ncbi:MAG: hypothetical protein WC640_03490 [Candidatus Paceibacterota bacterium]
MLSRRKFVQLVKENPLFCFVAGLIVMLVIFVTVFPAKSTTTQSTAKGVDKVFGWHPIESIGGKDPATLGRVCVFTKQRRARTFRYQAIIPISTSPELVPMIKMVNGEQRALIVYSNNLGGQEPPSYRVKLGTKEELRLDDGW